MATNTDAAVPCPCTGEDHIWCPYFASVQAAEFCAACGMVQYLLWDWDEDV